MSTAVLPPQSELRPTLRIEFKALMKLAIPIAIAQAGQALMGLVDTLVMGHAGTSQLAAAGLGNGLFFAISSFGMGLMMGLDPLLSQAIGARNESRARALLWQGGWLALAAGSVLWLLLFGVPALLPLVGVVEPELSQTRDYLIWRSPSLPLMLAYMTVRTYLTSTANIRPLVVSTLVANVVNLMTDLLLVFGGAGLPEWTGPLRLVPALGVKGAAIDSVLCTALQLGIVLYAVKRMTPPDAEKPSRKPVWADLSQAIRIGTPAGLHIAAEIGVFALAGVLAAGLGPASMAAHQIAISFSSLTFTVAVGVGNAGSVRVGWAVGARDAAQARLSGFVAFGTGAAFMSLWALVFAVFPGPLAKVAGAASDVLPLAIPLLMVSAIFQVFDGVQGVGAGVLRGLGDTRFTFIANMVGHYVVGLPLTLLLGFKLGMGVVGIWWGLCMGLILVAFALVWRFNKVSSGDLRPIES
ncbi:MATE family efflux transporter [Myxococcus stipitatus]|uniref:MATE family efflux transporter n=1 Tax=Myxococcus stipitatus TaxID=83455 RepID=UPI003144E38C